MATDFRAKGKSITGSIVSTRSSAITHTREDGTECTVETAIREVAELSSKVEELSSKVEELTREVADLKRQLNS